MNKRGIIYTNLFPNNVEKTRGIFVYQETLALKKYYDLKVVAPLPWVPPQLRDKRRYAFHYAARREVINGIEVYHPRYIVTPRLARSLYGEMMFWGSFRTVRRICRNWGPEFMISHYAYPDGYVGVRLSKRAGIPVIVKVRGSDVKVFTRSRLRRTLTALGLRDADAVVAVSEDLKRRTKALGIVDSKLWVIRNGVDCDIFKPMDMVECRKSLGLGLAPYLFLYVGNMKKIKGVDLLVDAFRRLPTGLYENTRLIMIGSGEDDLLIERKVSEIGNQKLIRKLPPVAHAEVAKWMGACNCVVLPSLSEGYPNVVLEAGACHRPVIASRVGGVPEIVREGRNGILVEPGNVEQLKDALIDFLEGSRVNFEFEGRLRGWNDVAREMVKLINMVIEIRKRGYVENSLSASDAGSWR